MSQCLEPVNRLPFMEKETLKTLLRTWFPEWGDVIRSVLRNSLRSRGQGVCIGRSLENDRYTHHCWLWRQRKACVRSLKQLRNTFSWQSAKLCNSAVNTRHWILSANLKNKGVATELLRSHMYWSLLTAFYLMNLFNCFTYKM